MKKSVIPLIGVAFFYWVAAAEAYILHVMGPDSPYLDVYHGEVAYPSEPGSPGDPDDDTGWITVTTQLYKFIVEAESPSDNDEAVDVQFTITTDLSAYATTFMAYDRPDKFPFALAAAELRWYLYEEGNPYIPVMVHEDKEVTACTGYWLCQHLVGHGLQDTLLYAEILVGKQYVLYGELKYYLKTKSNGWGHAYAMVDVYSLLAGSTIDNCPEDPDKLEPGICGCGVVDTDTDADGIADCVDADDDNDGVADTFDPEPFNPDVCGDSDGDGCDDCEVGTDGFGPLSDSDPGNDGPDRDNDGLCDAGDTCPNDPNNDVDGDGVCGDVDNCPAVSNSDQADADNDGLGDVCDACPNDPANDADGDGICGDVDNCPAVANPGQGDADNDGLGDVCDACPSDPDNDFDGDGFCGDIDNCPGVANLYQEDTDGDGQGDLCDLCPADSQDQCDPNGSTAEEFSAGAGGTLETADGNVKIVIDPGDLAENTTISVTQTVPEDPQVNILIGKKPGLGEPLAVYVLEPDGLVFQNPVTVTIKADITHLNQNQRERVSLYQWNESQGGFVAVEGAACSTDEEPPGTFIKMCTAELTHFSVLAMVAPLDSDDDGIFDLFDNEQDLCPYSDLTETVTIEICETGVENVLLEGGCTVSDLIAECAVGARNHGQFVSCVAHLTNDLKSEGIIKGREKGAIQRCAAKADIP